MSRRAVFTFIPLLVASFLPHPVRAGADESRDPFAYERALQSSKKSRIEYRRWRQGPARFRATKPCGVIATVDQTQGGARQEWNERLARVLDPTRGWIPVDSLRTGDWLPDSLSGHDLRVIFGSGKSEFRLNLFLEAGLILVSDTSGMVGGLAVDGGRADTIIALMREALPPIRELRSLSASPNPWRPVRSRRRYPPYGALPVCDDLPESSEKQPPEYPEAARSSGTQGEVSVAALVDESGQVLETRIVHSVLDLDRAAVMAVEQWQFQPAKHFDRAVPVWIVVPVRFTLH